MAEASCTFQSQAEPSTVGGAGCKRYTKRQRTVGLKLLRAHFLLLALTTSTIATDALAESRSPSTDDPGANGAPSLDVWGDDSPVVGQGASVTVQLQFQRNGSSFPYTASFRALPPGVSGQVSTIANTASSTLTVTLTAVPNAQISSGKRVTVQVESANHKSAWVYLNVSVAREYVLRIPRAGTVTTASTSIPLKIAPCTTRTVPVVVELGGGATGPVALSTTSLNPALTATITPTSLNGTGTGKLTLVASSALSPLGSVSVALIAKVGGIERSRFTFPLTMSAPYISTWTPLPRRTPMFDLPGTTVTVEGGGFCPGTAVTVGGSEIIQPRIDPSGGSMSFELPLSATAGKVTLKNPATALDVPSTMDLALETFRSTKGFAFGNTKELQAAAGPYTVADADALFGTSQTRLKGDIVNPLVRVFLAAANLILTDGLCYGMDIASLRITQGQFSVAGIPTWTPGGFDPWFLTGPDIASKTPNPRLLAFIRQQHMAQFSAENIAGFLATKATSAAEVRSQLEAAFRRAPGGVGAMVAINPRLGVGHLLLAYDVEPTADGGFDISSYNPNRPYSVGEQSDAAAHADVLGRSKIHVNPDGSWWFRDPNPNPDSDMTWSGPLLGLTVIPFGTVPVQPSLPTPDALAYDLSVAAGDAQVTQVTDARGKQLLAAAGTFNTNAITRPDDIRVIPTFGGARRSMGTVIASRSSGPVTQTIIGQRSGHYSLVVLARGIAADVEGIATAAGVADTLVVDRGTIELRAAQSKSHAVRVLGKGPGGLREAVIRTGGGMIRVAYDPSGDAFVVTHGDAASNATIELATAEGARITTSPIAIERGDTITLRPDWSRLASGAGTLVVRKPDGRETKRSLR